MTTPGGIEIELRQATRSFLAAREPASVSPDGYDGWTPEEWRAMAEGLGLAGIDVDETAGGLGLGPGIEAVVHEEMGRVLYQGPYFSTVAVVLPMLEALPTAEAAELVRRIVVGEAVFGVAAGLDPAWPELTPDGVVPLVRDADAPDGVLLGVLLDGQPAVVRVEGFAREPVESVDVTRPLWRVRLGGASVHVLARGDEAVTAVHAAARHAAIALAAESVGVAERAMELTVAYVAMRHQFGRAIGSFQAVKHQCADLLVAVETARSALDLALSPDAATARTGAAIARLQCGRSAWEVTESAVHLHGGIGFTWEHRIQLYFRRAKTNQVLLADGTRQRDLIVAALAAG